MESLLIHHQPNAEQVIKVAQTGSGFRLKTTRTWATPKTKITNNTIAKSVNVVTLEEVQSLFMDMILLGGVEIPMPMCEKDAKNNAQRKKAFVIIGRLEIPQPRLELPDFT